MIELNNAEKKDRIKVDRKNCYTCGVLLKSGEEFKRGNDKIDVRWFCKKDYDYKPKKMKKRIVLRKR